MSTATTTNRSARQQHQSKVRRMRKYRRWVMERARKQIARRNETQEK